MTHGELIHGKHALFAVVETVYEEIKHRGPAGTTFLDMGDMVAMEISKIKDAITKQAPVSTAVPVASNVETPQNKAGRR